MEKPLVPAENEGLTPENKPKRGAEILRGWLRFREKPTEHEPVPKDRADRLRSGIKEVFTHHVEKESVGLGEAVPRNVPIELPAPLLGPESLGGFVNPNEEQPATKVEQQVDARLKEIEARLQQIRQEKAERPEGKVQSVKEVLEARAIEKPIIERVQAKKTAEQLAESKYENENPETVLEKVEEVAEKNVPLEAMYERRHEAKDEDQLFAGSNSGAAAPVPPPLPIPDAFTLPQEPIAITPSKPKVSAIQKFGQQPEDYKKAALQGALGALTAILLSALAFALF